jgi:hypothetical protein
MLEGVAPELAAFVGDDVPGSITHVTDRSLQNPLNVTACRMVAEEGEADHGA